MAETIEDRVRRLRESASRTPGPAAQQSFGPVTQLVSDTSSRGGPPRMPAPGEAYAAARQAIDAEKAAASKPAAPEPERGILPGEEQVTTFDTFRMLNPSMRKGIESVYSASGHKGGIPFEDWLSENYGDLPPTARTAAMEGTAVEHGVALNEPAGLPANAASPLARDRVARDMPLPEGRDLRQYSPEQRKVMAENLHNPEVPMTPFGGTFTLTSEGAKSIRAPDPNLIATAEAAARTHGEGSQPHVIALAKAMHIDTSKYRQRDYDMLVADTMREKARYDAKQASSDIERMPTGAFRYVPNERTQENVATRNRQAMARDIGNRYARMLTPEQAQMLDDAAKSENGVEVMRGLNEQLRRQYERDRHRDAGNRATDYNVSRDLQNPTLAPGMNVRTLIQAVRSGDPQMAAAAYDIMGNPAAAAQSRQLAASFANADATSNAAQVEAANSMAMARLEAETQKAVAGMREGTPEDGKMLADLQQEQMNSIYALQSPDEQLNAMRTFVQRTSPDLPPPQVEARAMANIAAHRARKHGINDPVVQAHLTNLFNTDRNAFMQFAQISLNMTEPQAKEFYNSKRTLLGKAAGLVGF